jgi:hypothetical protein
MQLQNTADVHGQHRHVDHISFAVLNLYLSSIHITEIKLIMALYHRPWPPTSAPAAWLDPSAPIEEETLPRYNPARFYPIRLGQILNGRYQVATKLGYGARSTVWLARDLIQYDVLQREPIHG